jgi:hypothetical protein
MPGMDKDGNEHDLAVLEDTNVAFDPTTQHLDLTKDEKRRTTALIMAIQAYQELIIKDAAYLREASDLARRDEGPKIQPATIDAIIVAAMKFDAFIESKMTASQEQTAPSDFQTQAEGGAA